jgi:hypothetical protein
MSLTHTNSYYVKFWYALDTVDTMDTVDMVDKVDMVDMMDTVDTVDSGDTVYTVDTVDTVDTLDTLDCPSQDDSSLYPYPLTLKCQLAVQTVIFVRCANLPFFNKNIIIVLSFFLCTGHPQLGLVMLWSCVVH